MNNPVGAPRTVSPPKDECIKLGEELVKWVTEETIEFRCLLQQFYSIKKGILRKNWKTLIQRPEFVPYYEIAQAALAAKCVNGAMKEGFGQRYLRLYDRDLVEEENQEARFRADLSRKKEEEVYNIAEEFQEFLKLKQSATDEKRKAQQSES